MDKTEQLRRDLLYNLLQKQLPQIQIPSALIQLWASGKAHIGTREVNWIGQHLLLHISPDFVWWTVASVLPALICCTLARLIFERETLSQIDTHQTESLDSK